MKFGFEVARVLPKIVGCVAFGAVVGCGGPVETGEAAAEEDIGTSTAALGGPCQINPNGTAICDATAIKQVVGRKVYYRVGANSGPGYDAATGKHSAVVLFQGTGGGFLSTKDNGTGGNTGPGATWGSTSAFAFAPTASFGVHFQVATVIALINAGYTVIQPAARRQCTDSILCAYAWDTNFGAWNTSLDKTFMNALVAELQPGSVTFGGIDINHVYATGISSGGYMSSRIANEYSGGIKPDGTVVSTSQPFRAVAIQSGSYEDCAGATCTVPPTLPVTHPPTFFLHDMEDGVVPYSTMVLYRDLIQAQFGAAFVGNDDFTGNTAHHQWDSKLTATSTNFILVWFNGHR